MIKRPYGPLACASFLSPFTSSDFQVRAKPKGTGAQGSDDAWGDLVSIDVPAGEVVYVTHVAPYFDIQSDDPTHATIQAGSVPPAEGNLSEIMIIAQCVVAITTNTPSHMNLSSSGSFSKTIVMDGGEHGKVWFRAAGSSWSVHAWVGHPSKIPGLSSKI